MDAQAGGNEKRGGVRDATDVQTETDTGIPTTKCLSGIFHVKIRSHFNCSKITNGAATTKLHTPEFVPKGHHSRQDRPCMVKIAPQGLAVIFIFFVV